MCGRKTLSKSKLDIIRDLSIDEWDDLIEYNPSYNITPTQNHPVIIKDKNQKKIKLMKWGLIPSWSKDISFAVKMINARQETLVEKPFAAMGKGVTGNVSPYIDVNMEKMVTL